MFKAFVQVVLAVAVASGTAQADPEDDARRIVELTVTEEVFGTAMAAMGDLIAGNFQNQFAKNGVAMSNEAANTLSKMLTDEMTSDLVEAMIEPMIEAWVANHSAATLAAYRDFLETSEGQEIIANMPFMVTESTRIGELVGQTVATSSVQRVIEKVSSRSWPDGTPEFVQIELKKLFTD